MPFLADGRFALPVTDPILTFALLLLVILIAPLIVQRLRGPGMIGLIVAGIVLGPNGLGLFARDGALLLLGSVGLLYIMFSAGLELDLPLFRKYRHHSLVFGSATFLIPQVVGTVVALLFLRFDWAAAILLASMFASHTPLTYPIASRLGIARSPAVTTAIGGTIITDTIALLVLAVVARSAAGALDTTFWLRLAASLVVYAALIWWGLPLVARWFFRALPAEGSAHFVFILTAVFLCSGLAASAGVEPIIGAFLAGLALNRLVPDQSVLMNRIQFAGSWLFVPFFLLSVGMLVDPAVFLKESETWKVSIAMVVTVVVTKLAAAVLSARLLGYERADAGVMFGLSVNQAAATLAAVIVGLRIGIFDDSVLNGAIMMILVTCLLGPWATQRFGRALALRQSPAGEGSGGLDGPRRILVPLRNPEAADAIMDVAFMVREPESDEPVYPLTVVQESAEGGDEVAAGERMLGHAVMHAVAAEVPVVPTTRIDTSAAAGIMRAIRELRIGTVVMGWTGTSPAASRVFGSVLDDLLEQCPQQFVVCRFSAPLNTAKRLVLVLAPFAQREAGFTAAIGLIKRLAKKAGLTLSISGTEQDLRQIKPLLARIKPDLEAELLPIESIARWADSDGPRLGSGDLFALLSARRHQVSWQPIIDRLPKQMITRSPHLDMVVVYPRAEKAGPRAGADQREVDALPLTELFAPERLVLRRPARDVGDLLRTLLTTRFEAGSDEAAPVVAAIEALSREAPIEIAPGVMLVHASSVAATKPIGFLGTSRDALPHERLRHPVATILILVTPRDFPAAAHLKHLASISRLFHDPRNHDRIRSANHPSDIAELLAEADV